MRKTILGILVLFVLAASVLLFRHKAAAPSPSDANSQITTIGTNGFNKQQYSTHDPDSIWVVINKPRAIDPIDYVPIDLIASHVPQRVPGNESMQIRAAVSKALDVMFADAKQAGINLMLSSGYRSYTYQVGLYNGYVKSMGQAGADKISARPGHSEHQTGLAADIEPASRKCEIDACFADTPEGKWLAEHAYEYGFIIRYPADKVDTTGYAYEPWHVRYVGIDLANELHKTGVKTLEDFFGLPGGSNY